MYPVESDDRFHWRHCDKVLGTDLGKRKMEMLQKISECFVLKYLGKGR